MFSRLASCPGPLKTGRWSWALTFRPATRRGGRCTMVRIQHAALNTVRQWEDEEQAALRDARKADGLVEGAEPARGMPSSSGGASIGRAYSAGPYQWGCCIHGQVRRRQTGREERDHLPLPRVRGRSQPNLDQRTGMQAQSGQAGRALEMCPEGAAVHNRVGASSDRTRPAGRRRPDR